MSFLQSRNNLGDLESLQQARDNLGIGSMAFQLDNNVHIHGGRATLSELRLSNNARVSQGYVLSASNEHGVAVWRELAVASWMNRPPHEVSLAGLCNDARFVTESELNTALNNLNEPTVDTLIGDSLDLSVLVASNVSVGDLNARSVATSTLNTSSVVYDGSTPAGPAALMNRTGDVTAPLELVQLENAFDSSALVPCSSRAVSNLYAYVREVARNIPDETGGFMISTNNLSDLGLNAASAVSNLGLNQALATDHLTLKDVLLTEPSYNSHTNSGLPAAEFAPSSSKTYKLLKEAKTNLLVYEENTLIHAYTDRTQQYPASAYNVNTLYEHLDNKINDQLMIQNVLSELIENNSDGSENPYRSVFRQRLRTAGLHEVAFSGSWSDLHDAPRSLSAFDNMGGNDETLFLYSKSNFVDVPDKHAALKNLGVADVAVSGNISDLTVSGVLRAILDSEGVPGGVAQATLNGTLPFVVTENNLREFAQNPAAARSNLGIGDMATFDRNDVEILGGAAAFADCVVRSNLQYRNPGKDGALEASATSNVFLKCVSADGYGEWARLPTASVSTEGTVFLSDDYTNPIPATGYELYPNAAVALSAHAASNMFAFLINEINTLKQMIG